MRAGTQPRYALAAVLTALAVVLVLALAGLATHSGRWTAELPRTAAPTAAPPAPLRTPPVAPTRPAERTDAPFQGDLEVGIPALVVVGLLLLLSLVGLVMLVRRIPRWHRGPKAADVAVGPAGTALPDAVERALEVIEDPDAREAVIRAWLLLGAAAAEAGTPARPAETAAEYARRLAAAHDLPVPSLERLAALYREARFSDHEVRPGQREQAREELHRLRAALAGHAAAR